MHRALLVALVLLLSGCSFSPGPSDPDGPGPTASGAQAEASPPATNSTAPAAPVSVPLQASGSLPPCVGAAGLPDDAGILACKALPSSRAIRFQQEGTLHSVNLTLDWAAASPTMAELHILVAPVSECGVADLCFEGTPMESSGASPLMLVGDGLGWTHGEYAIIVEWSGGPEVTPEQPFGVAGALLALP